MAFWSTRPNKKALRKGTQKNTAAKTKASRFHCVEIKTSYDACEAVLKLHGKRFLSADAPMLPVAECDQPCKCTFKHYEDRRQDERRDAFDSRGIHFSGEKNRRLGGDRRLGSSPRVGFI